MGVLIEKVEVLAVILCAAFLVMCAASPVGADTVLYSEGFEDDNGGFTADAGGVEWGWGVPSSVGPAQAHTGTKCWGTNLDGNAPADASGFIVSPVIAIPEIPDLGYTEMLKIRFWGYVDIDTYARARLYISPNNDTQIPVADFYLNMRDSSGLPGQWSLYEFSVPTEYYNYYHELGSRELEFIFYLETTGGGKPGFYIDDLAVTVITSEYKRLTLEENSIGYGGGPYSPQASFFIYTWDGTGWVMRDGTTTNYGETTPVEGSPVYFDLSPYLPDPDGEYKVRIWQDFMEGTPSAGPPYGYAAIDWIRFRIGEDSGGGLDYALDLRYGVLEYPNYESDGGTYPVKDWVISSDDIRYQIDEWDTAAFVPLAQKRWSEYAWYGFSVNKPPTTNPVTVSGDTITWTYTDKDDPGYTTPQAQYEVEIWTEANGCGKNMWDPPVGEGTATSVAYSGDPLPDAIYYIRVKAYDGSAWSSWSETEWDLTNLSPIANAGPDVTVKENEPVTLDGSSSTDPDDGIAAYLWEQIGGIPVTIENANQAVATFPAPVTGPLILPEDLYFRLTVTDFKGLSDSDVCKVSVVNNIPPQADAGADQIMMEHMEGTLNGAASTDPDGVIASYFWEQTKGPAATINTPSSAVTTFVTPEYDAADSVLEFTLTVTDDGGLAGKDTCQVTLSENMPPAVPLQISPEDGAIFATGESVMLTASAYWDPEGDPHVLTSWVVRRMDRPTNDYGEISPLELQQCEVKDLPGGLQYAWMVGYKDTRSGAYSWSEKEWTFTVGSFTTDASVKVPTGWGINDYLMVSFSTWPEDPEALSVFGVVPDTTRIRIGTYDPTLGGTGGYIEYGDPALMVKPGTSYWFLVKGGFNPVISGIPVSLDVDVDVPLLYNEGTGNGWNMIAAPNNADYRWDDVEVLAYDEAGNVIEGPTCMEDLSYENTMIDKRLWRWEDGTYYSDTAEIEKHSGYWLKARKANVWLRFPAAAHMAAKGITEFYASLMMKEAAKMARAWGVAPAYAATDTSDMPPMPMAGFSDTGSSSSSSSKESGGGCFIGTTR